MANPRDDDLEDLLNQDLDNLFRDQQPNDEEASAQSNNSTEDEQDDNSARSSNEEEEEDQGNQQQNTTPNDEERKQHILEPKQNCFWLVLVRIRGSPSLDPLVLDVLQDTTGLHLVDVVVEEIREF